MRIFVELPTWLGDAVMATGALELLIKFLKHNLKIDSDEIKITFFGSILSAQLYKTHPNYENEIIDNSKKSGFRILNLINIAKELPKFDFAISFRSHIYSKIFFTFIKADKKAIFKNNKSQIHHVEKYTNFISKFLGFHFKEISLKLYFMPYRFIKPTLGLNPGASYGSAKRWYPEYFAAVAIELQDKFDIVIFGAKDEASICEQIADILSKNGVKFTNLCAKTTISSLCENIAGLSLFITNDSGPMHIAAAYKIPTIALFGPTKFKETSPYKNPNARIIHLNLSCMPCMKRICPLKTHECMKKLTPNLVLDAIYKLHL